MAEVKKPEEKKGILGKIKEGMDDNCLLYTSDAADDW